MRTRSRVVGALAISAGVLVTTAAASSAPSRPARPRTIAVVHDFIGALAQSKGRLAWLRGPERCPKAEMFDSRSHRRVRISSRHGAACGVEGTFGLLAFDGTRVLWQGIGGYGNTEVDFKVFSAALRDRRTRVVGRGALERGPGLEYEPPLPMAGGAGHLYYYERCEVGCDASEVRAVIGRRSRRLFPATRPVALAVAGHRLAVLEDRVGCCQYSPAWSPDGTTLAWLHNGELVTASADGSGRRVLATGDLYGPLSWAPDGSALAFSRSTSETAPPSVGIVNADGAGERTFGEGQDAEWSPDGTEIAFVRRDDVYRVSADGSQETRLTSDAVEWTSRPRWSPDGKKLLVERGSRAYLVDALDGGASALTPTGVGSPVLSPDGTQIGPEPQVHQRPVERPLKDAGHLAGRQKRVIPSCLHRAVVGTASLGPGIVGRSRAEIERAACVRQAGGRC